MTGFCPCCNNKISVSDYADSYRCSGCGDRSHPEFLRSRPMRVERPPQEKIYPALRLVKR
jgi:predicted amidophosphoribosyltransferase